MATTHLLYLHGFRSSPKSFKARRMHEALRTRHPMVNWWCPQLPPSPKEAAELIDRGTAAWPVDTMAVVGSSLGGYYATWIAEARECKAVLLNPAVHAARDLARHVGEQVAWHDPSERFFFRPEYVDELRALERGPVRVPSNYFAVIAKGDEVLDWREMTARYPGARIKLLEGGDHAISDFDVHVPDILAFLDCV